MKSSCHHVLSVLDSLLYWYDISNKVASVSWLLLDSFPSTQEGQWLAKPKCYQCFGYLPLGEKPIVSWINEFTDLVKPDHLQKSRNILKAQDCLLLHCQLFDERTKNLRIRTVSIQNKFISTQRWPQATQLTGLWLFKVSDIFSMSVPG